MTLFDLIFGGLFTKHDWRDLGRGQIMDEKRIAEMLAQGYEALAAENE